MGVNKIAVCLIICLQGFFSFGQSVTEVIDSITYKWDEEAEKLSTYEGLIEFCAVEEYRYATIDILKEIHHYDSALYDKLISVRRRKHNDHELNKTIKEIEEFESKYTTKNFIHFLHEDCTKSNELEKEIQGLRRDSGEGSYDNQVYILEVELGRYVHHVTKKIDQIRNHVHHLYK